MRQGQKIGAVVVLLVLAGGIGLVLLRSSEQTGVQAVDAPPVVSTPSSASAAAVQQVADVASSSNTAAVAATAQNEAIVLPEDAIVSEPDSIADESEPAQSKPSQKIVNAIKEIKKPTPNEGQVTTMPDGSQKVELGNRYRSVPVATVGKDGKLQVDYHGERHAGDTEKDTERTETTKTTNNGE